MVDGGGEGVLITGSVGVILILILKVAEGSRLCKVSTPPGAGDIQGSVAVSVTEEQRGEHVDRVPAWGHQPAAEERVVTPIANVGQACQVLDRSKRGWIERLWDPREAVDRAGRGELR